MANEVANVKQSNAVAMVDEKTVMDYMDSTGLTNQLLPGEKKMFMNLCTMYGLNPFKREVYCTAYGQGQYRQCSIVTGYEVYLKRAERIGKLDGYDVDTTLDEKGMPIKTTVTIFRKDWSHPFKHTVYFKEYVQRKKDGTVNKFWLEKPITMIEKVAKAQAFRLCFPDEFDGIPYTHEEMSNLDSSEITERMKNVTPQQTEQPKVEQAVEVEAEVIENPMASKNELRDILNKYEQHLAGEPSKMALECLKNGNSQDIEKMIVRVKTYLSKKNVNVA